MWAKNKQSGFTIVELLIVVVVIAILAVITIVSYNGIQERARISGAQSFSTQLSRSPDMLDATGIYNFDECSGTTTKDVSDAKNDGTLIGTTSWSTDTPSGRGCSVSFDGTGQVNTAAVIGSNFYIKSAWVKTTNCASSNNIISGSGSAFYGCSLRAGHNGSWTALTVGGSIGDGKWHHVMLKYENGTITIYVDGRNAGSVAQPSPTTFSTQIGALGSANRYVGLIDDVIIIAR